MTRRRKGGRARPCAVPERGTPSAAPKEQRPPWWQGSWQALGGLFNLLAALANRWPYQGH